MKPQVVRNNEQEDLIAMLGLQDKNLSRRINRANEEAAKNKRRSRKERARLESAPKFNARFAHVPAQTKTIPPTTFHSIADIPDDEEAMSPEEWRAMQNAEEQSFRWGGVFAGGLG